MTDKTNKDISLKQSFINNAYAIKLLWSVSRRRTIHMFLSSFINYMTWMFYSTFFVRFIVDAIENERSYLTIFAYIFGVCFISILLGLYLRYVKNVIEPLDDVKVYQGLYGEIYKKAENVELACYEDSSFYDRYTMAVDKACDRITETTRLLFEIIAALCAGMITYIAMFRIDKWLILFLIAPLIGNFYFGAVVNKYRLRIYKENTPFIRRTEYVNRVMYLADYSKEMRLSDIYSVLNDTYQTATKNMLKTVKKYFVPHFLNNFGQNYLTYTIIFEGILLYGAYCALVAKTISLGQFVVLTSMMGLASWAMINSATNLMKCGENGMYIQNLRAFMNHQEVLPESQDGLIPDRNITSIEFRNVNFEYKLESPVLKNMSFIMTEKSSLALVGHNGAGKSTIIKLLFRLYDPTGGEILVNGIDIRKYNLKAYRGLFSAAFQDYKIFAGTVRENILMGRHTDNKKADDIVLKALESAHIAEKVAHLPNGIDTILTKEFDEDGAVMSGGEFQKIVVARAFANSAPIKIFDEPSSALDPIAEYELFESILKESADNFMVFISHRLSSVKNATEVILLEQGEIIERGTHAELMALNKKYADMYDKQAKNYQVD